MPRVIGRFPSAASGKQKEKGSARIQTKNRPSCRVFLNSCLHDLRSAVYLPRQEINRVLHRGDTHTKRSGQGEELGWISDWRYHPIERERGREKRSVWKLNFNGVSMSLRMEALCWGKRKNNDLCIWLSRRKEEKKNVYCMVWIPPSVGSTQNLNFSSLTREHRCSQTCRLRNEALRFEMVLHERFIIMNSEM